MFVSDGAFTDSAISVALEIASNLRREFGKPLERNWINITENMQIPTSETGVVLEFRNMWNDLVSKQADVILMDYPFDYRRNFTTEKRRLAMDYVGSHFTLLANSLLTVNTVCSQTGSKWSGDDLRTVCHLRQLAF